MNVLNNIIRIICNIWNNSYYSKCKWFSWYTTISIISSKFDFCFDLQEKTLINLNLNKQKIVLELSQHIFKNFKMSDLISFQYYSYYKLHKELS